MNVIGKIIDQWKTFRDEQLCDWYYIMSENGIFERGVGINQWNKPLWYEILNLHIN